MYAALSPHPDDYDGSAFWRAAAGIWHWHRLRTSPAPGNHHCRRARDEPTSHSLHHSSRLFDSRSGPSTPSRKRARYFSSQGWDCSVSHRVINMDKYMNNFRLKCLLFPGIYLFLLSGCTVGPRYHPPAATLQPPPIAYKELPKDSQNPNDWKVAQPQDAMLHGKWWEIYHDPELNALEEQLNINNQNIRQSFENFMEARALVAQARAQLFPTIAFAPSFQRSSSSSSLNSSSNSSSSGSGSSSGSSTGSARSTYTLPLEASWAPDLWGKVRNTIHEFQYNAQLSAADLENERLTEQASLAVFFFELRGQDAVQKIFDATVEADKKSVELTRARYETGVDTEISLVQAENALQSAEAASPNLGIARAQFEHAIAMLIGTPASKFSMPVKPLEASPPKFLSAYLHNFSS